MLFSGFQRSTSLSHNDLSQTSIQIQRPVAFGQDIQEWLKKQYSKLRRSSGVSIHVRFRKTIVDMVYEGSDRYGRFFETEGDMMERCRIGYLVWFRT